MKKAQKRERAIERKNPREQNTLCARERERSASIAIVINGIVPIGVDRADRDLAIEIGPIPVITIAIAISLNEIAIA